MADEELYKHVLAELKHVRGEPGTLDVKHLRDCPTLIQVLGSGDVFDAFGELQSMLTEYVEAEDKYIRAAAMSFLADGDNILKRLDKIGEVYYIDQRTARRWSDRGLESLARLVSATPVSTENVFGVSVQVTHVIQEAVLIKWSCVCPPGMEFKPPMIWLNGSRMDEEAESGDNYEHSEQEGVVGKSRLFAITMPPVGETVHLEVIARSLRVPVTSAQSQLDPRQYRVRFAVQRQSAHVYVTERSMA